MDAPGKTNLCAKGPDSEHDSFDHGREVSRATRSGIENGIAYLHPLMVEANQMDC